jgi:hypothetical protein
MVFPLAYVYRSVDLTYSIDTRGIVYPAQEWVLMRTLDGNLINSIKDKRNNSISNYSVTEFQRGDMASFRIFPEIYSKETIQKGDTIGIISSQYEQGRYLQLQGELNLQKKLLQVYATGEKQDQIKIANQRIDLARQEYETQQRITERNRVLFEKSYIPEEEYELSVNDLNIKKQNYLIAESEFVALSSGAKQEQLDYVMANITALEHQLSHLESIMQGFVITSPVSGRVSKQQGPWIETNHETILSVADMEKSLLIIPIDVYNTPYIMPGQQIIFSSPISKKSFEAIIIDIDNASQMIWGRQKVFITAMVSPEADFSQLYPNMQVDVSIPSKNISVREYFSRLVNEVYNN